MTTTADKTTVTANPNTTHAATPASVSAVNRALQQFLQSPSVSNKVAAPAERSPAMYWHASPSIGKR